MQSSDSLKNTISKINNFVEERDWGQFHTVKNLAASVSIEAAELNETIQWENPELEEILQNDTLLQNIGNEIADVVIYSLRLCSILNLNVIALIDRKIESNKEKYPINKSKGSSKKYTQF